MALGNYSSFLYDALGGIGDNISAVRKKQQDDKSLEALANSFYRQRPQTISNLGASLSQTQPTDLIPQGYTNSVRSAESGGNLNAKNPNSSATGPYQFTQDTWSDLAKNNPNLGLTPDGRTDPAQNEKAITAFTQQNAKTLYQNGIPVHPGTLYAAHFLGAGDAIKVLGAESNAPLTGLLSNQVISSNPFLKGMTVGQFKEFSSKKGGNPNGGYQVASNDPNFMPQMPSQGLQAPPTITNQVPNGAQNPVAQTFAAQAQDTGQPQAQGALPQQPQVAPQQMSQAAPQQATQGLPQQFTPQNNQSMLPDRETMLQLLKSEATRPYAIELAKAARAGQDPGFVLLTNKDNPNIPVGAVVNVDKKTGKPEVLIAAKEGKRTPYTDAGKVKSDLDAGFITQDQANAPQQDPVKFTNITAARKDFENQPGVNRYRTAAPIVNSMISAVDNPSNMADLDFIYGMAKILDPNSVVRESEMGLVINSQSIPDELKGYINKATQGGQKLSQEARRELTKAMIGRVNEYKAQAEREAKDFTGLATRHGIDPQDIARPLDPLSDLPVNQNAPVKIKGNDDYSALPSGATYIDPDGNTRKKP